MPPKRGGRTVGENVSTSSANVGTYTLVPTITYSNSNYIIVDSATTVTIAQAILIAHFPEVIDGKITPTFTNKTGDLITVESTVVYLKATGFSLVPYSLALNMSQSGKYKAVVIVDDTDNYKQDPEKTVSIFGYSGIGAIIPMISIIPLIIWVFVVQFA